MVQSTLVSHEFFWDIHTLWCFMICSDYARHHARQTLIPVRVKEHAWPQRMLWCMSQGLRTHDMTFAFGSCQCPLAWLPAGPSEPLLAGNRMDWWREGGNHHGGLVWLPALLKVRVWAEPAALMSGGAVIHGITSSCWSTWCRPWERGWEKVFQMCFS